MTPARIGLRLDRAALLQRLIERRPRHRGAVRTRAAHDQDDRGTQRCRHDRRAARGAGRDRLPRRASRRADTDAARARVERASRRSSIRRLARRRPARAARAPAARQVDRARAQRAVRRRGQSRTRDAVASRPRRRPGAARRGGAAGDRRRSRRAHRARPARSRTGRPRGREGARHPAEARLVHDADGRVVVEPHPQRPSDGRLHRRHDHRAGRGVLVQRRRRAAHIGARVPRGADDHRLARPAVDRRRRVPDGDDALQRRVRARPADPRSARTTTSISRTTRSDATRRSRGAARTSGSGTT